MDARERAHRPVGHRRGCCERWVPVWRGSAGSGAWAAIVGRESLRLPTRASSEVPRIGAPPGVRVGDSPPAAAPTSARRVGASTTIGVGQELDRRLSLGSGRERCDEPTDQRAAHHRERRSTSRPLDVNLIGIEAAFGRLFHVGRIRGSGAAGPLRCPSCASIGLPRDDRAGPSTSAGDGVRHLGASGCGPGLRRSVVRRGPEWRVVISSAAGPPASIERAAHGEGAESGAHGDARTLSRNGSAGGLERDDGTGDRSDPREHGSTGIEGSRIDAVGFVEP